ncbi:unnamed protein product [Oncorhynchus mykiss]|uniref:Histone acetyltransferase type B catalytic subunit n=1 Tax=Oncorhynchus mykiss TaxID=8022 RepID=A0A060VSH6_ONCMY|nr:unnamed protein product [Oncorhynchus mykiss]
MKLIAVTLLLLMMSKGRSGRSFPLGSAATQTTSPHCWRKRPTSNPSVPCFTHTTSTMWRRVKTVPTRFTRWTCRALDSETTMSACRPSSCGSLRRPALSTWTTIVGTSFSYLRSTITMGRLSFATVGYMTVYNYYVYPDKTRPRVSQMLILPPFQGEGHGAQLLEVVHRFYCNLPKVQDITAEDPSENYVKLRDYVLVKLCQTLPIIRHRRASSELQ